MGVIHCPPTIMMKVILFLAAICGAAYSDVSCDDCKVAAAGLIDRLTSEESIAEQIGIMIAAVCPSFPAELDCEGQLTMWWGDAANCLFNEFLGAPDACMRLGYCDVKSLTGEWTCEDCQGIMGRVAAYMEEQETIDAAVAFLSGECFCGQPEHNDECPATIEILIPAAIPILGMVLREQTDELCQDIVGVC